MPLAQPHPLSPSRPGPSHPGPFARGSVRRAHSRLRRIAGMDLSELACRARQQASKWIDRTRAAGTAPAPAALLERQAPLLADPVGALRVVRESLPGRFFAGTDMASVLELDERFPDDRRRLVAAADQVLAGRFDLLGYRGLWFGDPIDWHLDPVWSRRAPLVHWSRLDPLDASVGDSKVVWELNRHQWIVRLAQAHAVTGDDRYAAACVGAIDAWLDANPPGIGLNWASSLEVSFRLVSWCWTLALLRHWPSLSGAWLMKMLAAIGGHATHVRKYLSYYFSPNTHLTGEALGLFYAGTLFPEFRDAARWQRLGRDILVTQGREQVTSDGVYFEQSSCYHRYTVEIYLHFLLLAGRHGIEVPRDVLDRTALMVDFLVAIRRPDGSMPAIGDTDGGQWLPLAPRGPQDLQAVFAAAAVVHGRPDFALAAGGAAPEVLWLMGRGGLETFDRLGVSAPASAPSQVFATGGYAILRDGWNRDGHQMIVDIGPLGCPVSSGHGHADLLSVQLSIFGEPCLVDAGTGGYTPESQWRNFFRSTAAHSTIAIDGQSQSEPHGPFGWRRRPQARLLEWLSTPEFDLVDAEHDGYVTLARPVVHRRRVLFIKPDCWILIDDLQGHALHQADLTFQFAPVDVTLGPHPWARAQTPGGAMLWVRPFAAVSLAAAVKRGDTTPIRGWVSPDYGQRRPAPALVYSGTAPLPWRIFTVLLANRQVEGPAPLVHPIHDEQGEPIGLSFAQPRFSIHVDDTDIRIERG